jgi:TolB-like protein/Flp pilus assembly protein TadD
MEQDTDGTVAAWAAARSDIIDPSISNHSGHLVKHTGDGFLAEFSTVQDAVQCAIVMQEGLTTSPLDFRIGINLGDIIDDGEDIHGEGVNIAARIQALAEPGGICISGMVFEAIRNRIEATFEDFGVHEVKHVSAPIRVYRLVKNNVQSEETRKPDLALPDKPSIAVLPFANMSGDPEQEYFADGISEDIITALSKLRWFLVIARNSTFVYKGKTVDIKQVVRDLGVRYVLEGSVRKSGSRLRISAQLIDAENEAHLWAENYDRELTDIFELQDEITQSVTAAIEPKLVAAEGHRFKSRSASDLDAWHLVMRAMTHYGRMTTKESELTIEILRQAVEKFPDYGPAHSLLAFVLLVSGHVGWIPESDDYNYAADLTQQASRLAHRAAELDNEDPWAHLALGYVAFMERRTENTVREYMRAIELNPNFATAYGYLGWALVFDGQSDKALEYFQQAIRMSPHDPLIAFFYSGTGVAHYFARRYDDAIEWTGKAIAERPGFTAAHRIHCASLAQAGKMEETCIAVAKLKELQPNISIAWMEQHVPYTSQAMPHFLDGMRKSGIE